MSDDLALVSRLKEARKICLREGQTAAAILLQDAEDSIVGSINLGARFHAAANQKAERDILKRGKIMNARAAIDETMALAKKEWHRRPVPLSDPCALYHLVAMHAAIEANQGFSYGKLCRWLGWMQASVVSWGTVSLETIKEINKRHADEPAKG